MIEICAPLEAGPGFHTVRPMNSAFKPMAAADFHDEPARLTARQASFYRNLIAIAVETRNAAIPVVFKHAEMGVVFLDRGCIKIAEHAGFIRPLVNGANGTVDEIELAFKVTAE